MATRGRGEAAADEEFLNNLYRGGELLAAGKVIEAKDYLERAYSLQPKNEKAQNLLGLTYFKLGLFDRAAEIYEGLVRENPVDATLRVNLGLVYLKTNQLQRAIREFETSVDLQPDHKKAHNYLGLALAQQGNYSEAKEHFIEAGSDAMAMKMERAMSGEATGLHRMPAPLEQQQRGFAEIEGSEVVAERGGQQVVEERRARVAEVEEAAPPPPPPPEEPPPELEVQVQEPAHAPTAHEDWGSHFGESSGGGGELAAAAAEAPGPQPEEDMRFAADEGPSAIAEETASVSAVPEPAEGSETVMSPEDLAPAREEPPPEEPPAAEEAMAPTPESEPEDATAAPTPATEPLPVAEQWTAKPLAELKVETTVAKPLAELAPTLEVLGGAVTAPFEVREEGVAITVHGELLTRVEGLLLATGPVRFDAELKRFRGRTTDQPFGEGEGRVMRATGRAVLVLAAGEKRRFVSVDLAEESAYFREEAVFAFEEAVMFENGRIPSEITGDLDLVHLRGKGKVLLRLGGPLRTHQVRMDGAAIVPLNRLVGWFGNVTPKLVPLAQEESGALVTGGVELSGEGFVLFTA